MDFLLLLICLVVLTETTYILFRSSRPIRNGNRKIFVDTSALIDGRIVEIARTGFLEGDLVILKSVLRELQLLADGKDNERRTRARAGLDNVSELERVLEVNTEVLDDIESTKKVDDALLKYAKEFGGAVLTLDYNLIKVAEAEKVTTLNINDLALATKIDFRPGTRAKVKILEKGSGRGQGIGHLEDGTMIVVEHASNKKGKEVIVEYERLHETSAGRMVFAKLSR